MARLPRVLLILLATATTASCRSSPPPPDPPALSGRWSAALTAPPCAVGDWSAITLQLTQNGTMLAGELVTKDSQRFRAVGLVVGMRATIDVTLAPGGGECQSISFAIGQLDRDSTGRVTAFSGQMISRGAAAGSFRFTRAG